MTVSTPEAIVAPGARLAEKAPPMPESACASRAKANAQTRAARSGSRRRSLVFRSFARLVIGPRFRIDRAKARESTYHQSVKNARRKSLPRLWLYGNNPAMLPKLRGGGLKRWSGVQ